MKSLARCRKGQALVEFALVLPLLLLLILGIVEFGRAWNAKQILTDAAREGARLSVIGNSNITDTSQVNTRIRQIVALAGLDSTTLTITYPDGFKTGIPNVTSVKLSLPFQFVVLHRLVQLVTSSNGTMVLSTTARMRNE
jgi:Flp pilus assembly protein TadG